MYFISVALSLAILECNGLQWNSELFSTSEIQPLRQTTPVPSNGDQRFTPSADQGKVEKQTVSLLPNLSECGTYEVKSKVTEIENKIFYGDLAEPGNFPWMALLGHEDYDAKLISWTCGGSLITDRFVLTASHCLPLQEPKVNIVRLGELDFNSNTDGAHPEDFQVDRIVKHPEHNATSKTNDIGLIKLKEKVIFSDHIKPICLPPREFSVNDFVGKTATVAGWGKTELDTAKVSDSHLRKADTLIQDTDDCKRNYTFQIGSLVIDHRLVCTSAPGKNICQGDSGGPLMFKTKTARSPADSEGNYFVMGIVSYGRHCSLGGYPAVYTRVSAFMSWIIDNLEFD